MLDIINKIGILVETKKKDYKVIDLFCGCGGLSEGFKMAGFDVFLGVDWDDAALETFEKNHKNAALKLDLFDENNIQTIKDIIEKNNATIDVLIGGPPCQGFSIAGPRDMNDKRNKLYLSMVKLANEIRPKIIVLENVPGMIQTNNGIGASRVISDFKEIGYKMEAKLLYAPDYGVPQIRKRVFFVGTIDDTYSFSFPDPILKSDQYITCKQAIDDLPSLQDPDGFILRGEEIQDYIKEPSNEYQQIMRKGSNKVFNHIGSIPIEKTRQMISLVPEGKNYKALPEQYRGIYKYHEALTRYNSNKPSLTINTCHRSHFHYKYNRIPTVRESARLQSFPDSFIFYGNKAEQYKQVGNAVPPLLAYAVACNVRGCLEKHEKE